MNVHGFKYSLKFKIPAGTSRGILQEKESWFIFISDKNNKTGIGECGLLKGLSFDDVADYEDILKQTCLDFNTSQKTDLQKLETFPSIRFGFEMALMDYNSQNERILFPSKFTEGENGILINGLVWMGEFEFMQKQIREKIDKGFRCIKIKIGAIDFKEELQLIKSIRKEFSKNDVEIRVDANGAFDPKEALEKLKKLAEYSIHSIEQPIKKGQWVEMVELCATSPIPIALDEELIGVFGIKEKKTLLNQINPQYIILKPSLLGGFAASEEWINLAEQNNIDWWVTSALESNIGLSAIAQWTYMLDNQLPQGLGTGQLYANNFKSPLFIENGYLGYSPEKKWDLSSLI